MTLSQFEDDFIYFWRPLFVHFGNLALPLTKWTMLPINQETKSIKIVIQFDIWMLKWLELWMNLKLFLKKCTAGKSWNFLLFIIKVGPPLGWKCTLWNIPSVGPVCAKKDTEALNIPILTSESSTYLCKIDFVFVVRSIGRLVFWQSSTKCTFLIPEQKLLVCEYHVHL